MAKSDSEALRPFGDTLSALRHRAGLAHEAFAELVDCEPSAAAGWEQGHSAPSAVEFRKIEAVLRQFLAGYGGDELRNLRKLWMDATGGEPGGMEDFEKEDLQMAIRSLIARNAIKLSQSSSTQYNFFATPLPSVTPVTDPPARKTSAGVFISYRRSDEPGFAGRLYDRLSRQFGEHQVFMDVDSIELGLDFVDVLEQTLEQAKALIVIIGRQWLSVTDPSGRRRLDNPDDRVRLEIETGLKRAIRVIPILVDGATMPDRADLPKLLAPLARRNGREMSNARFGSDVLELVATLERILVE